MKKCTLLKGRRTENRLSGEGKRSFDGNYEHTHLYFKSVNWAFKAAELADLKSFRIVKVDERHGYERYDWRDKILFETKDITAYYENQDLKFKISEATKNRSVKAINSWPALTEIADIGIPNFKVFLTRGNFSYDRAYSSSLRGGFSFRFFYKDKVIGRDSFCTSSYFTNAGGVQVKKFKGELRWELGIDPDIVPSDFNYKEFLIRLRGTRSKIVKRTRSLEFQIKKEVTAEMTGTIIDTMA